MPSTPDIAVIGLGLVTPLGGTVEENFTRLCGGDCAFRQLDRFDTANYLYQKGGQLPSALEDSLRQQCPDQDLCLAMLLRAAREALASRPPSPGRLAIVLGTNFGLMETQQWAWQERLDTGHLDTETYAPLDDFLSTLTTELQGTGPVVQVSMSCASGTSALRTAADILAQGRADTALVLAYDALTEYCWCGLSNLHTITADTVRPFDIRRSGTVFSEGAAALLLQAVPSGDDCAPLAWLRGCATNNNAFHLTAPPKEAEGSRLVMLAALEDAGMSPADIDHLCAHATGTKGNDSTEAAAFRNLIGAERLATLSVSAHKSQFGHLLGAASLAETVVTILAMQRKLLPPNINNDQPDPACAPLTCPCGQTARHVAFDTALTNSAGLGGNNAASVFSSHRPTASRQALRLENLHVRQMGWILPAGQGQGSALLSDPQLLAYSPAQEHALDDFSAKPYLKSTKGYLDPGAAFLLAAFSLALDGTAAARLGMATATRYGAQHTAFAFYRQMQEKGPRAASPLLFPHGYASTPGNLAAMEFAAQGPHQAFFGNQDIRELLLFALARLSDGSADEMAVGAYETAPPATLPDGRPLLRGALALRLAATPADGDVAVIPVEQFLSLSPHFPATGAVSALANILLQICQR
jgi:3-oxoacyl-(acyl-carrier-protein) synthase